MKVYIVYYQYYDHFEVLEVFSSRQLALEYIESPVISDKIKKGYYKLDCLDILEKVVME